MIGLIDKREDEVKEKYPLQYKTSLAAGFDFPSNEDVIIPHGEHKLVKTGLYLDIEKTSGLELGPLTLFPYLAIVPRSGLARDYGITILNSPATIDADYEDEIGIMLYNTSIVDYSVRLGERIGQGIVQLTTRPFDMIPNDVERGDGGFGSTGK